jgi:uncharacterized protein (DUF58 family)
MLLGSDSRDRLGSLRLRARGVVEGAMGGQHRNPHRGASVEFAEYKEYAPGDEIRHIDWRAWGRVDRYFVKQFEDETNYRAYLLLDTSGSMGFSLEERQTKLAAASTLLAAISWILLAQGDAPGLLCFDERPGNYLPPSSKRSQFEEICRLAEGASATGRTSVEMALSRIAERVQARSLVCLFSDFLEQGDDLLRLAKVLRRKGHEVALFHLVDPAELELPFEGLTLFEGLEGEEELLAEPDDLREEYARLFAAHLARIEQGARASDLEYQRVSTDDDGIAAVRAFVAARQRRKGGR